MNEPKLNPRASDDTDYPSLLEALPTEIIRERIAAELRLDRHNAAELLDTYLEEAAETLRLVRKSLFPDARLLEIGAGSGLASLLLKLKGYDVTALDPSEGAFAAAGTVARLAQEAAPGADLPWLDIPAQSLEAARHGTFDVIFSVNAFEHISHPRDALSAMSKVLRRGGVLMLSCPNYWVPYEPHFGIPLVPIIPQYTAVLLPSRICRSATWRSLSFPTYGKLRRWARELDLEVRFESGTLFHALARLDSDKRCAARHKGPIRFLGTAFKRTALLQALKLIPPALSTPMCAEFRHHEKPTPT